MTAEGSPEERVFERRLGLARWAGLGLLVAAQAGAGVALPAWGDDLERLIETVGAPAGMVTGAFAHFVAFIAPTIALGVALRACGRRFARCEVGAGWLVFEPALLPAWMGREAFRRDEVVDRALTPAGLVLTLRARPMALFPVLVPARAQAEVDAAIAALDAPAPDDLLVAGRPPRPDLQRLALLPCLTAIVLVAAALFEVVRRRFDSSEAGRDAAAMFIALLIPTMMVIATAFMPGWRRTFLGRRALVLGEETFDLSTVDALGAGDGHLVAEDGARACLAWVGDQDARLREALAARLAALGRPVDEVLGPLPSWATRGRRRLRFALRVSPALLLPAIALAGACLAPNLRLLRVDDVHGQTLLVVHAIDADRPLACAFVTATPDAPSAPYPRPIAVRAGAPFPITLGDDGADLLVDLASLGSASFVLVDAGGVRASSPVWVPSVALLVLQTAGRLGPLGELESPGVPSAAATLEGLAIGASDPLVAQVASGRASVRCFEVRDADSAERVVWGVDRGRVAFVVRAPVAGRWLVRRGGLGWATGRGLGGKSGVRSIDEPWVAATLDAAGGFAPDPTLPTTLDALLEVRRRVEQERLTLEAALQPTGSSR